MSHFTVAVISNSPEDIENLLAPYQENNMGDCPEEFLAFNDLEDEYKKEYENEGRDEWHADISHVLRIDKEQEDFQYLQENC
jgi:hypothetical protein